MRYNPTNDYVFKRIFGYKGNERIVKDLIEAIIGEKFSNIQIENPILQSDDISGKTGILDVRLKADDSSVDIEMQVVKSQNIKDRALWYWSKMFQESIIKGDDYTKTKRTICIIITDFILDELEDIEDYHTQWNLYDKNHKNRSLTNKIEIHIIELGKIGNIKKVKEDLIYWCTFLKNPERIGDSIMNDNIKAAKEELEKINSDDLEKRRADEREKAIMDHIWWKNSAIEEGRKIGMEKGKAEASKDIAKNLLSKGMSKEEVAEVTGLSIEEINKIK